MRMQGISALGDGDPRLFRAVSFESVIEAWQSFHYTLESDNLILGTISTSQ